MNTICLYTTCSFVSKIQSFLVKLREIAVKKDKIVMIPKRFLSTNSLVHVRWDQ